MYHLVGGVREVVFLFDMYEVRLINCGGPAGPTGSNLERNALRFEMVEELEAKGREIRGFGQITSTPIVRMY